MRLANNPSFVKDVQATFGSGYTQFTSLWDAICRKPSVHTKKACEAIDARHTKHEDAPAKSLLGRIAAVALVAGAVYVGYTNFSQIASIVSKALSL